MKFSDKINLFYQLLNFAIFLYFTIALIKKGQLEIIDLLISGIALLGSIIVSIIEAIERLRGQ